MRCTCQRCARCQHQERALRALREKCTNRYPERDDGDELFDVGASSPAATFPERLEASPMDNTTRIMAELMRHRPMAGGDGRFVLTDEEIDDVLRCDEDLRFQVRDQKNTIDTRLATLSMDHEAALDSWSRRLVVTMIVAALSGFVMGFCIARLLT